MIEERSTENPVAPSAPAAEEAPKRRPGRPRKVRPEEAPAEAAGAQAAPAEGAPAASEEAPKRRPGRPRKADADEAAPTEGEAVPAKPARRAHRAAAEQEAPAAGEAPASPSPASPEPSESAEGAERPRRTRRVSRTERLQTGDGSRPEAAEASSEQASPAPAGEAASEAARPVDEGAQPERRDERSDLRPGRARRQEQGAEGSFASKRSQQGRKQRDRQERNDRSDRSDRPDRNDRNQQRGNRFQRRQHNGQQQREPQGPKTTAEDLEKLKVAELREKAVELGVEHKGLKKAELVAAVLEASVRKEGFIEVAGILDIMQEGYGFLRTEGYLPSEHDVYVGLSFIRRNGLRKGDHVTGQIRPKRDNEKYAAIQRIHEVNGLPLEQLSRRPRFADLTPVYPDERLIMEHGKDTTTARVIDLVAPIGKGQRGLIVSPPKAGKTTVLKDIAASISANNPEVHLMCLLVDERPEEVTDMERSIRGEVISSTFDMPSENHIAVSELVIERAKRLVEMGKDVVILLDSITRLARAYNLAQPASGRVLSGGVDSTALYPPKRFLGAARNIEHGGSLTILASALIETGSKMDEVIFEEFKGTGNMELKLDRSLADRRIFPAIDPITSGTRKEELLLASQDAALIWAVRQILANLNSTERAMDMLIRSIRQTRTNEEFLLKTAAKARGHQSQRLDDNYEL